MCFGGGGGSIEETEDQKVLAEIGMDKWRSYQQMYPEMEQMLFDDVGKLNTQDYKQRAANEASAAVSGAYTGANRQAIDIMAQQGVDPSSGRFADTIDDLSTAEAISKSHNVNRTQQAVQDQYLQGKSAIVAMGQGQEAEAIQGFGDIAQASSREAISDAYNDYEEMAGNRSAIATAAGAGVGVAKNYKSSKDEEK